MVIRFVSTTNRPDVSKSRDFIIFCFVIGSFILDPKRSNMSIQKKWHERSLLDVLKDTDGPSWIDPRRG